MNAISAQNESTGHSAPIRQKAKVAFDPSQFTQLRTDEKHRPPKALADIVQSSQKPIHPFNRLVNERKLCPIMRKWKEWRNEWRELTKLGYPPTHTANALRLGMKIPCTGRDFARRAMLYLHIADASLMNRHEDKTRNDADFSAFLEVRQTLVGFAQSEYGIARCLAEHARAALCREGGFFNLGYEKTSGCEGHLVPLWLRDCTSSDVQTCWIVRSVIRHFAIDFTTLVRSVDNLNRPGCFPSNSNSSEAVQGKIMKEFAIKFCDVCLGGLRVYRRHDGSEKVAVLMNTWPKNQDYAYPRTLRILDAARPQCVYILNHIGELQRLMNPEYWPDVTDQRGWTGICSALHDIASNAFIHSHSTDRPAVKTAYLVDGIPDGSTAAIVLNTLLQAYGAMRRKKSNSKLR
jgi:hypothetical protein